MLPSIIIVIVIAALVVLDVRYIFRKKKQGECIGCSSSGCGCGSADCPTAKKFEEYHAKKQQ
ncbi:FeoB-associated Cys-rich membrane protein [Butyrivibrio sp. VCD2006]|uniref:FeoB-associated Cys-rich membrane protein n=1 Tax=Butyrivibrio sp. VCD2006 TaxID=1280664 RepID=UPI000424F844|nr:FeoB-associated Cys-rich membrane protein [Butyrivibrio sp. VCD2006]